MAQHDPVRCVTTVHIRSFEVKSTAEDRHGFLNLTMSLLWTGHAPFSLLLFQSTMLLMMNVQSNQYTFVEASRPKGRDCLAEFAGWSCDSHCWRGPVKYRRGCSPCTEHPGSLPARLYLTLQGLAHRLEQAPAMFSRCPARL